MEALRNKGELNIRPTNTPSPPSSDGKFQGHDASVPFGIPEAVVWIK